MSTLPKIIAVDFDGTLFENAWPDVGAPIEKNINKLKAEQGLKKVSVPLYSGYFGL